MAGTSTSVPPPRSTVDEYKRKLMNLMTIPDRNIRQEHLNSIINSPDQNEVTNELRLEIIKFEKREQIHIRFVKLVFKTFYLGTPCEHDWSKDHFYVFVLLGRFGLNIGKEDTEFDQIFLDEVDRHYALEPHHSEFEKFSTTECTEADIDEMAIDKLTRNVVATKGVIDHPTMKRYEPTFYLGDTEGKQKLYWDYVEKRKDLVLQVYNEHIAAELTTLV